MEKFNLRHGDLGIVEKRLKKKKTPVSYQWIRAILESDERIGSAEIRKVVLEELKILSDENDKNDKNLSDYLNRIQATEAWKAKNIELGIADDDETAFKKIMSDAYDDIIKKEIEEQFTPDPAEQRKRLLELRTQRKKEGLWQPSSEAFRLKYELSKEE